MLNVKCSTSNANAHPSFDKGRILGAQVLLCLLDPPSHLVRIVLSPFLLQQFTPVTLCVTKPKHNADQNSNSIRIRIGIRIWHLAFGIAIGIGIWHLAVVFGIAFGI